MMKQICKSEIPSALSEFIAENQQASWNEFKDTLNCKKVKAVIFTDQGYLCAYCETKINSESLEKQRIEHYHSKSDGSYWSFNWENLLGVCLGGEDADAKTHPRPENLSCDAHKNHAIQTKKLEIACEGKLLNPLLLPESPCLFALKKHTGELLPAENCDLIKITGNQFTTTTELINNTIQQLNLNCDRLNQQRLAVFHQYEKEIKKARENNNRLIRQQLITRWFNQKYPSFFTTRRILLAV